MVDSLKSAGDRGRRHRQVWHAKFAGVSPSFYDKVDFRNFSSRTKCSGLLLIDRPSQVKGSLGALLSKVFSDFMLIFFGGMP